MFYKLDTKTILYLGSIFLLLASVLAFSQMVLAKGNSSNFQIKDSYIEVQRTSYPQNITLVKDEGGQEKQIGQVKIVDEYLISEIPENEFLDEYPDLKSGFQGLSVDIEVDQPLFKKENFYHSSSLLEKTGLGLRSLLGMETQTLPEYRLIKEVDKSKSIQTKLDLSEITLITNYKKTEDGSLGVKQTITLKNNSEQDLNLSLLLKNQIEAEKIYWNGEYYSLSENPRKFGNPNKIAFYGKNENYLSFYDFSDIPEEFNPELWVEKTNSQNLLILSLNISLSKGETKTIDPTYGLEIIILNVHSHPQAGDNWTVSFETKGTADLTITPDDQQSIDDLDFVSLTCAGEEHTPQILENDIIFYPDWSCDGTGEVTHLVNVARKHILKFQFGDQIAYAHNNPGTYYPSGTLISKNLFSTSDVVSSIDSFYSSSTVPASTTLWAQFSTTSDAWYSADNTLNGTTTIPDGQATTSLSALGWSGPYFYYKMQFETSDTSTSPVLDEIRLNYTLGTAPTVTTLAPSPVYSRTAVANGNVTDAGGGIITTRGFKYDLTEADNWSVSENGSFGEGAYSLDLTGLDPDTTYHVRAYAINGEGTSYGSYQSFTTEKLPYYPSGTLVSKNLFSASDLVSSIDSFYSSSTVPASTTLWAQFSTTSNDWYSASGVLDGTTTISDGEATTSFSALDWSGPNFYYKMQFETSDTSTTPVLDEIRLNYDSNFPPTVGTVILNGGSDIVLIESVTTTISATTTVTDVNGYADISTTTGKLFRSGVGSSCSPDDDNNCYSDSFCATSSCDGNSCTATCEYEVWFHADPTDNGDYSAQYWDAWIKVIDSSNASSSATSTGVEMNTLRALNVTSTVNSTINYGNLNPGDNTGTLSETTTVTDTGNASIDIYLYGTDMATGSYSIAVSQQEYSTSSGVSYASGTDLTNSTSTAVELDLSKPTSHPSTSTDDIYWGLAIPSVQAAGTYTGTNTFEAKAD